MIKVKLKQTALLVLTLLATTMATAQTANMSKYITLTVQQGQQIQLSFQAAAAGTPVKIVSGSTDTVVTVGTGWTNGNYTAETTTMTVYGDIVVFGCGYNGAKLTALDVSHNTVLTGLWCHDNQLTALDVSQNTALTILWCDGNQLTSLNLGPNTALVSLVCYNNQLTSLDVTQNTELRKLWCGGNQLTALDVSQNTALTTLLCYGNNFSTQAFNDLMCSLPARTTADDARFYTLWNASDAGYATFMATNSQIATAKNWQVYYWDDYTAIPATTGTYTCPVTTAIAEVASVPLAVYPNPATDILTVETEATGAAITLTDLTGRTVLTATATATATTLNIAHLSAGTYIVRVGDRVGKVVKR